MVAKACSRGEKWVIPVAAKYRFGVSTHLFRTDRLSREHLGEIAAFGFETVELEAARTHQDFHNPAAVLDLLQWLADARLDLCGLHVPLGAPPEDLEPALFVARQIPVKTLTLQIARPREAKKRIDRLTELAEPLGVTITIDSRSEGLSPIGSLVHFVEGFDARVGIALDFDRARREGDLVEAIEAASEHLTSIRLPVDRLAAGRIDWPSALTAVQKVGYEGPVLLEAPKGAPKTVLAQARQARERFEKLLCTFT